MTELEIFMRFLLALGLGAIIGAERERYHSIHDAFGKFGGLRTFMFISLFGALTAFIAHEYFSWFIVAGLISVVVMIVCAYLASVWASKGKDIGVTGEISAILAYFIGLISFSEQPIFAVVLAILITAFLYFKGSMHGFVNKLKKEEVYSTLVFAIIAGVILPFLPNQAFGPLSVLNPYKIWLMVVFISGLSFIGYILIKILGSHRGMGLTGLLGGLVSSTAVTMAMATKSIKEKNLDMTKMLVFATVIANAVMFVRVIVEVYVVNRDLLGAVLVPMLVMAVVALIGALVLWKSRSSIKEENTKVDHTSPLSLGPAIKFGILFGVVLFVVKFAEVYLGDTGVYIASIVSGFVDVDAITLAMAGAAKDTIAASVAVNAIVLAVMSNTVIKFGYAAMFGSKEFRKRLGWVFAFVVLAGVLSLLLF